MSKGYPVLFYDRLGVGKSTRISGFDAKAQVQADILRQIGSLIKQGDLTGPLGKPDKLTFATHAYSSFHAASVLQADPTAADAVLFQTFVEWFSGDGRSGATYCERDKPGSF